MPDLFSNEDELSSNEPDSTIVYLRAHARQHAGENKPAAAPSSLDGSDAALFGASSFEEAAAQEPAAGQRFRHKQQSANNQRSARAQQQRTGQRATGRQRAVPAQQRAASTQGAHAAQQQQRPAAAQSADAARQRPGVTQQASAAQPQQTQRAAANSVSPDDTNAMIFDRISSLNAGAGQASGTQQQPAGAQQAAPRQASGRQDPYGDLGIERPTQTSRENGYEYYPDLPLPEDFQNSGHGQGEELVRHRHKRHKSHTGRNIALAVLAALLVLLVAALICGFNLYNSAMAAKGHINNVVDTSSSLASDDMSTALANLSGSVESIQSDAAAAKEEVSGPLWGIASSLPFVGQDFASVQTAADVLNDFSQKSLPELQDVSNTLTQSEFSDGNGGLNLEPVIAVADKLTTVNNDLAAQAETLNALPKASISQIDEALEKGKAKFSTLQETVGELSGLVNMMPSFLGKDGERSYLLVAQSNAEIRSAGGLCGSIGSFTANNGAIEMGDFHSDRDFPNGNVADLVGENESTLWSDLGYGYFECNISSTPDFPQMAQMAASYWNQQSFGRNQNIDGVMSLDPVALGAMLDVTGSVTMPDGRVLDSSNAADFLLNTVYKEVAESEQDSYFSSIASQVVKSAFSDMDSSKLMSLAKKMLSLAQGRHVYFWSFHEDDVEALRNAGLTHEITDDAQNPVVGMYLNEMKASKIDYYCERTVEVNRVSEASTGSRYHVTVTFANSLSPDDVDSLPTYITANTPSGAIFNDCVLFTPSGGSISNITCSTGASFEEIEAYGRRCYKGSLQIDPGDAISLEWDVVTQHGSSDLVFDQTPTNSVESNISYNY